MRHSRILSAAMAAGLGGVTLAAPDAIMRQLYDYARERKFPAPETLARKGAELAGGDFPFASLAEAPEPQRVFFTAFRAVLEALEPFHEDDLPGDEPEQQISQGKDRVRELVNYAGCENEQDLVVMAQVGKSLMASIATYTEAGEVLEGWSASDPAEVVDALVEMVEERDKLNDKLIEASKAPPPQPEENMDDKKEPADDDQVDEIEKKRRIAQAETDKVIAESGGKFSKTAPKKNDK